MKIELIDEVLEALLFVSGDGIAVGDVAELLGMQTSEIKASVSRLKKKYGGKCGIHLITYGGKIQLGTNPAYADAVALVLNPVKEKELSTAALETVAIIAYKQPITRLEVEQIRGVNCDYAIQLLLKHNLIEVAGRRDAVGKPLLFGTTDVFLKRFQIDDITQLPDYEMLLESIKILEEKTANAVPATEVSIYNEFEIPDEETPDFLADEDNLQKIE
ncbi:MAG: SMC-Scp complex subunit ScpB [Clostridiales bacterium]|jgi:segregation and condensation protein B|nr:SMC-Scp complex subunit ScpB [Clostridiales bacterium]